VTQHFGDWIETSPQANFVPVPANAVELAAWEEIMQLILNFNF
jgi:hypothetical protein